MYISNNSNIGMATVLQQQQQQQQTQNQKNLMKTYTNGSNSDATGNHNKWLWQQQFENAALNMQYGTKPHQVASSIHPTSHVIAANNTPNYSNNSYTHQNVAIAATAAAAAQPANNNTTTNSNSNTTTNTATGTTTTAAGANNNHNNNITNSTNAANSTTNAEEESADSQQEIDIMINNVVCSFSVRCHLNLREIAQNGFNVEYRRENGMVTMKLRRPYTTASIWSSGRITCTGATSEDQAKIAARRYARCLEKLGFRVRFHNFRVVNVLGTCSMPWAIKIVNFSERYKKEASYEPELHPGVTYKLRFPKATLKIFSTGSITVTASCVDNVQSAIEHIFPLVYEFRKERTPEEKLALLHKKGLLVPNVEPAPATAPAPAPAPVPEPEVDVDVDLDEDEENGVTERSSTIVKSSNVVGGSTNSTNSINSTNTTGHRKRPLTTLDSTKNMNHKKRLHNGGFVRNLADNDDDEDADDPSEVEPTFKYTEFDDPEDLIEGPDDEDDDDM